MDSPQGDDRKPAERPAGPASKSAGGVPGPSWERRTASITRCPRSPTRGGGLPAQSLCWGVPIAGAVGGGEVPVVYEAPPCGHLRDRGLLRGGVEEIGVYPGQADLTQITHRR